MGTEGYPSDWDSRRREVYKRDGYTCQNCGRKGNQEGSAELHAHHVVPKSKGGTHSVSNLTAVCEECHKAIHHNRVAPKPENDSYGFASIPSQVTSLDDLQSIFSEILSMRGSHPASTSISDLQKVRELRTSDNLEVAQLQEPVFNNSQTKDIFQNTKNKIMRMKSTLETADPSEFSHSEDVQEMVTLTLEMLGLMMEYTNKVQHHKNMIKNIKCSECGNLVDIEASFCGDCGSELPTVWKCSECGAMVDTLNNDFCTSCGSEVNGFSDSQERSINESWEETTGLWNKSTEKLGDAADIAGKLN